MSIDDISEKVHKKLNKKYSIHQINQVSRIPWKFLLETMQSGKNEDGKMEGVALIYLGKFIQNKRYSNQYLKNRRDANANNSESVN